METKPEPKFSEGQNVKYVGDDKVIYKVRIDRRQHKSLGNMWLYSGVGVVQQEIADTGKPKGKQRAILNMREKEIVLWE